MMEESNKPTVVGTDLVLDLQKQNTQACFESFESSVRVAWCRQCSQGKMRAKGRT